ncbi:MAG: tRNA epoxyqueuosine(34) reductase QueG [Pseudomonadales bacterium]
MSDAPPSSNPVEPSPTALARLRQNIDAWAEDLGFAAVGVTDVDLSAYEPQVRQWLAQGFHGAMGYLTRNLDKRFDPAQLVPNTIRVVSARMDYRPDQDEPLAVLQQPSKAYVARYALGRDYHKVLRRRLAKLGARINDAVAQIDPSYRAFTDSAPVLEKPLAEKAGLGWIGKHSLLLNREAGSWFFLGEIYTSVPLPVDAPQTTSHCGQCHACMTVCPTQAIVAPGQLDARRCISYLTIENKAEIPESLRSAMGNRVFGCDDCQLYCPWNRYAPVTSEPDFRPRHSLDNAKLLDLFELSEAQFLALTEGSAMRRINYDQWQRNLAVALGNGPASADVVAALRARLASASPMVADHVRWALAQLGKPT